LARLTMDEPVVNASSGKGVQPPPLDLSRIPAMLWESAVEAFIQAIVISVLGTVAIEIAGGIWHEMTPSMPRGLAHQPLAEAAGAPRWNVWSSFQNHRFGIIFFALFALKAWAQIVGRDSASEEATGRGAHARRIVKQVSENWFRLIVGNAFGALISAIVVVWVQQFTAWYWVRHLLLDSVSSAIHSVASHVFGAGGASAIGDWFSWYGENQLKLTFWAFYIAAICDDLGIPNLKTLGRWCWGRMRKHLEKQACHG
jgi:hypothetical protein